MPDRKLPEKIKLTAELEKIATEILVANGRSVEPFIKIFNYSGENITTSQLGALVGVFEISEPNDESAYIVNFLASVAKKEYFLNPRRGAVESFEATLHKINLALSLLVKHGNTSWLGKLHGAIGVLEKNQIHFSVTGEVKILLLRNNHFSEISAGLASEESALHPIKTFVEVSSGRLLPNDKIIIASPELFTLLSSDDLQKNAGRMDNERFAQFLRTALINELDMAGAIILDIYESQPVVTKKQTIKTETTIRNVFSQTAFAEAVKSKNPDAEEPSGEKISVIPQSEYIDSKTGHIYIQGDAPQTPLPHPGLEKARFLSQEAGHQISRFFNYHRKTLRKGKQQSFIFLGITTRQGVVITRKTWRFLHKHFKNSMALARFQASSILQPATPQEKSSPKFFSIQKFFSKRTPSRAFQGWLALDTPNFLRRVFLLWSNSPARLKKTILAGSGLFLVILISWLFFWMRPTEENSQNNAPEKTQSNSETPMPFITEKNSHILKEPIVLATSENPNIASMLLNGEVYLATAKEIINVRENKHYALPAESGGIQFAAPMDDLSLIFIYTDARKFFAWSTINHSFVQNNVSLPEKTLIQDIDTYLTYLYILDSASNQIYRFPRAEGGFGPLSAWLKDSVTFEENARIAINENIFLASGKSGVQIFSRGHYVKNLESPDTPIVMTGIFTRPGLANIYALDATNKRVLVWNQDGLLVAQYFSEKLDLAQTLAVNEKTSEILVTTADTLLAFKMEQ